MSYVNRLQTHNGNNVPLGLYKDTACTIAATTDGDLVAAWRDELSGGGAVATQSTSSQRPVLRFVPSSNGGNMPVLEFDGVDDVLTTGTISFTFGSIYATYQVLNGLETQSVASLNATGFFVFYAIDGQSLSGFYDSGSGESDSQGGQKNNGWQRKAYCVTSPGNSELRRNGVSVQTGSASSQTYSGPFAIGVNLKGYVGSVIVSTTGPFDATLDSAIASLGSFVDPRPIQIKCAGDSQTATTPPNRTQVQADDLQRPRRLASFR